MPHPAKKSLTSKAQRRQSRVKQRQIAKDDFQHLQYLKSQLDDQGNPIDILNADETILNDEQKFIKRIAHLLTQVDNVSMADYFINNLDYEKTDKIIDNYNKDIVSSSWAESIFRMTYNCLRILGIDDFLKKKLFNDMYIILEHDEETYKQKMSDELMVEIINLATKDLNPLNTSELINSALLFYTQNNMMCEITEGGRKRRLQSGGHPIAILVVCLVFWFMCSLPFILLRVAKQVGMFDGR